MIYTQSHIEYTGLPAWLGTIYRNDHCMLPGGSEFPLPER